MKIGQYNRRNFLSSIAVLSAGTAFGSAIQHFSQARATNDLQTNWAAFWKKLGGRAYNMANLKSSIDRKETKGHYYKYGDFIYFSKENILAQPTWIFWNQSTKPADVVVTLFKNNHSSDKIISLNRYEMDALYRLSKEPGSEQLLTASFNNSKPIASSLVIINTKTIIKKNSQIQDITYYKGQALVFEDKIIHHA